MQCFLLSACLVVPQISPGTHRLAEPPREITVPGHPTRAHLRDETGADGIRRTFASISLDGVRFHPPRETHPELALRYRRFDPLVESPEIPPSLRAGPANRLFVVQYWTQGLADYRLALREFGAETRFFLPEDADVVALAPERLDAVRALAFVRSVTPFHPAYKLEEELVAAVIEGRTGPLRVNVLVTAPGDEVALVTWIEARGGAIDELSPETGFLSASVSFESLPELAGLDQVQWIDRWGPRVPTMNIARVFHGASELEAVHGLTGEGVHVEVLDFGCDLRHPDLQGYVLHGPNSLDAHGTCTAGIVAGDGLGRVRGRGAAPDVTLVLGDLDFDFQGGSRFLHTLQLLQAPYQCVVQSNSWVSTPLTANYNSLSNELDSILFSLDRTGICQGMGNDGTTDAGRESWAKNVISVGGVDHHNTLTSDDDSISGASFGPAADGRVKPDVASFYDEVFCTDAIASSGYVNGDYYDQFGGTSAATAIVAGHLCLVYEMWHRGMFGNPHPGATVFENAPFNTTAKALLLNCARRWPALPRSRTGWGYPDLALLSRDLARMLVVDETDVLTELQSRSYSVEVLPGEASLHATLVYRDPPGTTSSTIHRINDLDLTLVSPSGVVYRGNQGLDAGTVSSPGGVADSRNTVEHVILDAPESGTWTVTVTATEINQDSHVETAAVDADYALVVRGAKEVPLAPPAAPSQLQGRSFTHDAQIAFRDNASGEDGYELERSLDGVSFQPLAVLAPYENDYHDSGLTPGKTYHYRVRAFNALGPSDWSNDLVLRAGKASRR